MRIADCWYALQVMTGTEREVARSVSKTANAVLAPEETFFERRGHRLVEKTRQLLPGYVLIQLADLTADTYYNLLAEKSVIRLLGKEGTALPQPIPETEMETILAICDSEDAPTMLDAAWTDKGVTITGELPRGVTITKVDARQRRVTATLRLHGEDMTIIYGLRVTDTRNQEH